MKAGIVRYTDNVVLIDHMLSVRKDIQDTTAPGQAKHSVKIADTDVSFFYTFHHLFGHIIF